MARTLHITRANSQYQQWESLLRNRTKRHRSGEFLVQGVRPITLAIEHGWEIRALIYDAERHLSEWAEGVRKRAGGVHVAMSPDLLRQLGEKDSDAPEVVAVVALPPDDLTRIPVGPAFLGVLFDRPSAPGNIGSIIRSVDAFGGAGMIVTGHAADPYDPKAVRASTGSLFAVPTVRVPGPAQVLEWISAEREAGRPITVVGTDEHGEADIADVDLTGPTLLAIGNETAGLSAGWREACDVMARIPIGGAASSLNAAGAATVILYEAARQRATS